jgi:hypothetical protein
MAEFLRPEARAALWRWREVLVALALVALGVWWGATGFGILRFLGFIIAVIGGALGLVAVQRARFRQGGGGAGIVQIKERQLAYFGPLSGGIINLDDLVRVELDPGGRPAHWVLTATGEQSVAIPVDAEGADALFDAFAALPGIRTERMLEVLKRTPSARVTIWEATRLRLH